MDISDRIESRDSLVIPERLVFVLDDWISELFRRALDAEHCTGTGILAILASRLGAASVLAVDNDDWCIENASENILLNHVQNVHIQKDNVVNENNHFDIVIANINRNIILDNLQAIAGCMREKAILLLSGLLVSDEADILAACSREGLVHRETRERNGWIAIDIRKALSSK